jgi:predicted nucleic acid-binding protein
VVIFADTSFLFSLYGDDTNTSRAIAWIKKDRTAIGVTPLGRYELGNSLRFAEFRRLIRPGQASLFWSQFESDMVSGRIIPQTCNLAEVIEEASRISVTHTLAKGHRSFDILHVAAALVLGGKTFLTFNVNQKRLALEEGLKSPL